MDEAKGFSTEFTGGPPCQTGTATDMAQRKANLFPNEGGPAILEIAVPSWIMDILFADPLIEGFAQGGEGRFVRGFGLEELCTEWPNIPKRMIRL